MLKIIKKVVFVVGYIYTHITMLLAIMIRPVTDWYNKTFGVTFQEILYTIASPLKGANADFLGGLVYWIRKRLVLYIVFAIVFYIADRMFFRKSQIMVKWKGKSCAKEIVMSSRSVIFSFMAVILTIVCIHNFAYMDASLKITDYIDSRRHATQIYEKEYVDPKSVKIKSVKPKNLIYIYIWRVWKQPMRKRVMAVFRRLRIIFLF